MSLKYSGAILRARLGKLRGRPRKVDVRLPGKENSNSHGAGPVHLVITMIKWIRNSRLSRKNSLSLGAAIASGSDLVGF